MTAQRVALTGASGLLGGALSASLADQGHEVITFVRREPSADSERRWDPAAGDIDVADLAGVDTVINLSGAGIADRRWSPERKREILSSRVQATTTMARALAAGVGQDGPRRLINASAVGFYGDRGDEVLTESSTGGDGFLAEVVTAWESAAKDAVDAGVAVAFSRTGIVLAPGGGAMEPMLKVGRFGLGGPLGSGRQWMPWITGRDWTRAIGLLVDEPTIVGAVNVVGPAPARQRDIASAIGRQLRRPAFLPAPTPALRVILGEMATDILASTRAEARILDDAGFDYEHATLEDAVAWVIAQDD